MLETGILKKLDSLRELPTIPFIITEVLSALDRNYNASSLAALIEKDQTLTLRLLRVANSPFYGFPRKIATVELAVVILGANSIREILMSLVIQRLFTKVQPGFFDINAFWHYSIFCGASSRVLARKMGYRLAGEAFVAGLMHDIGILVLVEYFKDDYSEIKKYYLKSGSSLVESEKKIIDATHCDIGGWLAAKWNLPPQLCDAIQHHHSSYAELISNHTEENISQGENQLVEPLTAIVAMSEWFAIEMGFKKWAEESTPSHLYLANEVLDDLKSNDLMDPESVLEMIKLECMEEYNKASIFQSI